MSRVGRMTRSAGPAKPSRRRHSSRTATSLICVASGAITVNGVPTISASSSALTRPARAVAGIGHTIASMRSGAPIVSARGIAGVAAAVAAIRRLIGSVAVTGAGAGPIRHSSDDHARAYSYLTGAPAHRDSGLPGDWRALARLAPGRSRQPVRSGGGPLTRRHQMSTLFRKVTVVVPDGVKQR